MLKMTPRERLLAPFRGLTPDRPAWLADLGYWYDAHATAGTLPAEWQGPAGVLRMHEDLAVTVYYQYWAPVFQTSWDGVVHESRDDNGVRHESWYTPRGGLTARWEYVPVASCWAHSEYPVKTTADLSVLQDIFQRARHGPDVGTYRQLDEVVGDRGLPISPLPRSPLPALLTDWCGVEQTAFLLADEPTAVADTLATIDNSNSAAFTIAADSPATLFHFCDNLDSRNAGSFFEQHMAEYYRRRLTELHATGKMAVVHLDGAVRGLLPGLAACGFDGVESLTPAPVGDVAVAEMRSVAANERTILWGGLPGAMFCAPWTEADLRAQAQRWLDALGAGQRFIVGSADQVPPNGNIRACRAVAETIAEWSAT